jgi:TonB family protein
MYFDFEDHRPDIAPVGRAISWREGVLLSIIGHLVMAIVLLVAPRWIPDTAIEPKAAQKRPDQPMPSFVFVQPRVDRPAPKPPARAPSSDLDRQAQQLQRAPKPTNPLPFSRGNTPERVERSDERARGRGPDPEPSPQQADSQTPGPTPDSQSALNLPANSQATQPMRSGDRPAGGGRLGDALRNLGKYVQPDQFENAQGDGGAFGPAIQFDTKGVEFGPWIRRFIAQVKRNWLIPYSAMSMKGHVVVTFNVHKDGSISDLMVLGPSAIEAFNNAAYGALASSNPTQPLPPEYPVEKAFFTVTFFYNEQPQ